MIYGIRKRGKRKWGRILEEREKDGDSGRKKEKRRGDNLWKGKGIMNGKEGKGEKGN